MQQFQMTCNFFSSISYVLGVKLICLQCQQNLTLSLPQAVWIINDCASLYKPSVASVASLEFFEMRMALLAKRDCNETDTS